MSIKKSNFVEISAIISCIISIFLQIIRKNLFYIGEIMKIKNLLNNLFGYKEKEDYEFILPTNPNNLPINDTDKDNTEVYPSLTVNIEYLKSKFNLLINSDIKLRKFALPIQNKKLAATVLYIDGMVNDTIINNFVMKPLLLRNSINMKPDSKEFSNGSRISINKKPTFNLESYIYNSLLPHNSVSKEKEFNKIIKKVNAGFCILFVDSLNVAFCVETKGFEGRSVDKPITESIIRGSQEGFVENIRTNTSLIRKIINNEHLIIEEMEVRKNQSNKSCCVLS